MNPLLRMAGIRKAFPGVQALDGIDFDVRPGEVHALVGENGAGKSTLMHILAGVHQPDSGSIDFDGRTDVHILDEQQARRLGIAIVYQERSLFSLLSVAENIFANSQPVNAWGAVDARRLESKTLELLKRVNLPVAPHAIVGRLSTAQQQMVEIAKALSIDARLVIFDEPTAALTRAETDVLFGVIRQLKQAGVGIAYISHRLEEIFEIADRVTVLKDGQGQGTLGVEATSPADLVMRMVGRSTIHEHVERKAPLDVTPVLEVKDLSDGKQTRVSFSVRSGEILAFAGLAGAGRTELALAIFGVRPIASGAILVNGIQLRVSSPNDAIAAGIGYLPEDRKEMGLFLEMTVAENIAAARLSYFGSFWINSMKIIETARSYIERLRIATPDPLRAAGKLSGGNQQKVLLARWLLRDQRILIVDEPTRGIDVGAKAEIYQLLRQLADQGKAVVVISSDLPEVVAIADRVIVMRQGRIAGELPRSVTTEQNIMQLATIGAGESACL